MQVTLRKVQHQVRKGEIVWGKDRAWEGGNSEKGGVRACVHVCVCVCVTRQKPGG